MSLHVNLLYMYMCLRERVWDVCVYIVSIHYMYTCTCVRKCVCVCMLYTCIGVRECGCVSVYELWIWLIAKILIYLPDRTTPMGKMINNYLQQSCQLEDHAIHLLFAANRWEAMSVLVGSPPLPPTPTPFTWENTIISNITRPLNS